jgi:outer membrane lipoprotein-sorting protein
MKRTELAWLAFRALMVGLTLTACTHGARNQDANSNNGDNVTANRRNEDTPVLNDNEQNANTPPVPFQDRRDEVLAKMRQAAREAKTLQATIGIVSRETGVGGEADHASGRFYFKQGNQQQDRILINLVEGLGDNAEKTDILISGQNIDLYRPRVNQVEHTCRQSATSDLGIQGSFTTYERITLNFRISYLGEKQLRGQVTPKLLLTPKRQDFSADVQAIYAWIDAQTWLPLRVLIKSPRRETTIDWSQVQVNPQLPDTKFRLNAPADANHVKAPCRQ